MIKSRLIHAMLLAALLCLIVGCASTGPAVQLTADEQTRLQIATQEDAFMVLYRSARNYVLFKPQHHKQWNDVIQPAFSSAHIALAQYEQAALGKEMTPAEMRRLVDVQLNNLTQLLIGIGWVKQ